MEEARLEVADVVAYKHFSLRFLDQVRLVFGVVVPLGERKWVIVDSRNSAAPSYQGLRPPTFGR